MAYLLRIHLVSLKIPLRGTSLICIPIAIYNTSLNESSNRTSIGEAEITSEKPYIQFYLTEAEIKFIR